MGSFAQIFGISRNGMYADMLDLDSAANNLANINTNGYKAQRMNFQEMLSQAVLSGAQMVSSQISTQQGAFKNTQNPLDLAISGTGFFAVTTPDGKQAYTRDGDFMVDADDRIVDSEGNALVWDGTLPQAARNIEVTYQGEVFYDDLDDNRQYAGRISLYRFMNPSGLQSLGDNLFLETAASGAVETGRAGAAGFGSIVDYTLEASNVNLTNEFTRIITAQRSFQVTARALQQADQMMAQAIRMRQG